MTAHVFVRMEKKMATRKIDLMHKLYEMKGPFRCADCCHLICRYWNGRNYYKCEVYGDSASEATDWKKSNIACGLFNQPTEICNVVRAVINKREEVVLDGQIEMMEGES